MVCELKISDVILIIVGGAIVKVDSTYYEASVFDYVGVMSKCFPASRIVLNKNMRNVAVTYVTRVLATPFCIGQDKQNHHFLSTQN